MIEINLDQMELRIKYKDENILQVRKLLESMIRERNEIVRKYNKLKKLVNKHNLKSF